jgi:predicted DsbA family dithiol-disulfide isomerase
MNTSPTPADNQLSDLIRFVEGSTGTIEMEYRDYRNSVLELCAIATRQAEQISRLSAAADSPVSQDTGLQIHFDGLFAGATNVNDRITLLDLAKQYHIRYTNFAEAARYRDLEKSLKDQVSAAIATLGADILAQPPSQLTP